MLNVATRDHGMSCSRGFIPCWRANSNRNRLKPLIVALSFLFAFSKCACWLQVESLETPHGPRGLRGKAQPAKANRAPKGVAHPSRLSRLAGVYGFRFTR